MAAGILISGVVFLHQGQSRQLAFGSEVGGHRGWHEGLTDWAAIMFWRMVTHRHGGGDHLVAQGR